MSRVVNAMTIDVEDYFHVSAFEATVPRSRWDSLESRVVRNTDRLLDVFQTADVRATFFMLGWVAERHPSLVRRIAEAGHELASHGFGHRLVYDQSPAEFREDLFAKSPERLIGDDVHFGHPCAPAFTEESVCV